MALHDPLTGLANRTLLAERLQEAIDALAASACRRWTPAESGGSRGVAVYLLDLDEFKEINDVLGHDVGDDMLVAVARRLSAIVRPTDTVARLGGDEFVVVCDVESGEEEMLRIAERISAALARPYRIDGRTLVRAGLGGRRVRRQSRHRPVQAVEPGRRRHVRRQVEPSSGAPIHDGLTGWWRAPTAATPPSAPHRPGLPLQPVAARRRPGSGGRPGPRPRRPTAPGHRLRPPRRCRRRPDRGRPGAHRPFGLAAGQRVGRPGQPLGAGPRPGPSSRCSRWPSTWSTCTSPSPPACPTGCWWAGTSHPMVATFHRNGAAPCTPCWARGPSAGRPAGRPGRRLRGGPVDRVARPRRHLRGRVQRRSRSTATGTSTRGPPTGRPSCSSAGTRSAKGLRVLLEAFDRLADGRAGPGGPTVRRAAACCGSPGTDRRPMPCAAATPSRRFVWLGVLTEEEKLRRLAAADVLCAPSLGGESFGMVVLEAMAARTLVVASDIDGYRAAAGGARCWSRRVTDAAGRGPGRGPRGPAGRVRWRDRRWRVASREAGCRPGPGGPTSGRWTVGRMVRGPVPLGDGRAPALSGRTLLGP